MTENKNMALNDEAMAQAAGGAADVDPYGYLCEGTVGTGTAHGKTNGVETTDYSVDGDNGKGYWAVYRGTGELRKRSAQNDRSDFVGLGRNRHQPYPVPHSTPCKAHTNRCIELLSHEAV